MQRIDQGLVELHQGLAPGTDDVRAPAGRGVCRPDGLHMHGKVCGRAELAAPFPIGADKIGVAEAADGFFPVTLQPAPEVAAGKAQEHGRPAGMGAFALQGVEGFLDRIGHGALPLPACQRCQPFARSSQAGQVLQP